MIRLSLLLVLTSTTAAQSASFTTYGAGCGSGGPPPLIQAVTMPRIELYSRCQPTCVPQMIRVTNAATAVVGT